MGGRIITAAAAVCLLGAGGCGPSACHVTGAVTVAGQPLAEGALALEPDGFDGPAAMVPVQNGRYEVGPDRSLAPGHYRVRISPAAWLATRPEPPPSFPTYTTSADLPLGRSEVNFDMPDPGNRK